MSHSDQEDLADSLRNLTLGDLERPSESLMDVDSSVMPADDGAARREQERVKYVQEQQNSVRALRGHLTRRIRQATVCLELDAAPSDTMRESYVHHQRQIQEQYDKVVHVYQNLIDADPDLQDGYQERLEEQEDTFRAIWDALAAKISRCEAIHQPAIPQQQQGGPPRVQTKPCADLKPNKLVRSFTAADFRTWKRAFHDYYLASNMQVSNLQQQHAYLFSCMDSYMENKLRPQVKDEADELYPIFTDDATQPSCMSVIEEEFTYTHPMLVRRKQFLEIRQPSGQKFTDFAEKLERMSLEIDLANFTGDDLLRTKFVAGCTDRQLLERFLREPDPSKQDLLDIARQYEIGKLCDQAIRGDDHKVQVSKSQQKNDGKGKGKGNGGGDKKKGNKSDNSKKDLTCTRCGKQKSKEGKHEGCKADGVTCRNCGKKGHFDSVCFKPKTDGQSSDKQSSSKAAVSTKRVDVPAQANSRDFESSMHYDDQDVVRASAVFQRSRNSPPTDRH